MIRLFSAAATLALLAVPAAAFTARNGMEVEPLGAGSFRVAFPSPDAETQYLCAAGDYVIRALGMPASTRIFRESPPPRRQGEGIAFTLDPAHKVKMGLFSSFGTGKTDGGIAAGVARDRYCIILRIFPDF